MLKRRWTLILIHIGGHAGATRVRLAIITLMPVCFDSCSSIGCAQMSVKAIIRGRYDGGWIRVVQLNSWHTRAFARKGKVVVIVSVVAIMLVVMLDWLLFDAWREWRRGRHVTSIDASVEVMRLQTWVAVRWRAEHGAWGRVGGKRNWRGRRRTLDRLDFGLGEGK